MLAYYRCYVFSTATFAYPVGLSEVEHLTAIESRREHLLLGGILMAEALTL